MSGLVLQDIFYVVVLIALAIPLGSYIYKVMSGKKTFMNKVLSPVERGIYKVMRIDQQEEMGGKRYAKAVIAFSAFGFLFLFLLHLLQGVLPLNPEHLPGTSADLAYNTTASFVTNTNWQAYSGETTLSYLTQMLGLTVQNFVSAAVGIAVLFALSGLLCWCGISQVIGNSVSSAFQNAFHIPPLYTTIVLVLVAAFIVLRKNATVKVLDVVVPIMAGLYFVLTLFIIFKNIGQVPAVFARIFSEAFGVRQAVAGGMGAVVMNGIKRGLFSNEAGSGSAPCAAAAADISHPAKEGLLQALGVFIDTLLICSCSALIMLLTPVSLTDGLQGMDLLQTAMRYHIGEIGVIFIAVILWLFSFSTFIGILFYARSNVAYLFGDNWISQTLYKVLALVMLFIGGLAAYTFVWDLGDIGIGLMTIFNMIALIPLSPKVIESLKDYEQNHRHDKTL